MRNAICILLFGLSCCTPVAANEPDCEALAEKAANAAGVPSGLLSAIARVESGRTVRGVFRAWPWTLNQSGHGSYHATKADALAALNAALSAGQRNVDIGCMQINWHWHSEAFADLDEMLNPVLNTRYAADFLRALHDRHGDWKKAVMQYHSNDPQRGQAYARRVWHHLPEDATFAGVVQVVAAPKGHQWRSGLLAGTTGAVVDLKATGGALWSWQD